MGRRAKWHTEKGEPFTGEFREWAERVLKFEGYDPASVTFRLDPRNGSTAAYAVGLARKGDGGPQLSLATIVINVVSPRRQAFARTILHELAHVMSEGRDKHSIAFYNRFFKLVQLYGHEHGLTLDEAYDLERSYKSRNSASVAAKYGVEAAKLSVESRRQARKNPMPCYNWEKMSESERARYNDRPEGELLYDADYYHRSLVHVDGVPHQIMSEGGMYGQMYSAARLERCRNCGWTGWAYRRTINRNVWDPYVGRKYTDIDCERREQKAAQGT